MKIWLIAILAFLFLPGCAWFAEDGLAILDTVRETGKMVEDKALDAAAKTIDLYGNNAPEELRNRLRDGINSRTVDWDIMIVPNGS